MTVFLSRANICCSLRETLSLIDRWNLSLIGLFSFVSSFVNSSDFLRSCVLCSAPFPLRLELSYVRSLLFSASLFLSFYLMSEQSSTLIPLFTLSHRPLVPLSVPPSLLPSPRFLITLPRSMGLSLPPAGVTTGGTCVRSTSIDRSISAHLRSWQAWPVPATYPCLRVHDELRCGQKGQRCFIVI